MVDESAALLDPDERRYLQTKAEETNPRIRPMVESSIADKVANAMPEFNLIFDYLEHESVHRILETVADADTFRLGAEAAIALMYWTLSEMDTDPMSVIESGIKLGETAANPFRETATVHVSCRVEYEYRDIDPTELLREVDAEDILGMIDAMSLLGFLEIQGFDPEENELRIALTGQFPGGMEDLEGPLMNATRTYDSKSVDVKIVNNRSALLRFRSR